MVLVYDGYTVAGTGLRRSIVGYTVNRGYARYIGYEGLLRPVHNATEGLRGRYSFYGGISVNEGLRPVTNGVAGHEWYYWHSEATPVPNEA